MAELQRYNVEEDSNGTPITRGAVDTLSIARGFCRANPYSPMSPRDITSYDAHTLAPLLKAGSENGGIDERDRKMRYSGSEIRGDELIFRLGHSHYLEFLESDTRTKKEGDRLVKLGEAVYEDRFAFFPRNPGVTGFVTTSDNKLIVGYRNVDAGDPVFSGMMQGAARHLGFKENPLDSSLWDEMYETFDVEWGINRDRFRGSLEFLGLYSFADVHGDDLDFGFLGIVDLPAEYFVGGHWKNAATRVNHKELVAIDNYDELRNLVDTGELNGETRNIVHSSRGPLKEAIRDSDFQ
jgi:hypothetical protein